WAIQHAPPSPSRDEIHAKDILEAALFASGVESAEARQQYRERFDRLVEQARDAVRGAKTPRERGEKLLRFLHAGVMRNGYEGSQTSLSAVFDTGKYNCVS